MEANEAEVSRMILAGVVEGVGPRSGRIDVLRIICTEAEAIERLAAIRRAESAEAETAGSVTSQASREVFREQLTDTLRCWTFKRCRDLRFTAEPGPASA